MTLTSRAKRAGRAELQRRDRDVDVAGGGAVVGRAWTRVREFSTGIDCGELQLHTSHKLELTVAVSSTHHTPGLRYNCIRARCSVLTAPPWPRCAEAAGLRAAGEGLDHVEVVDHHRVHRCRPGRVHPVRLLGLDVGGGEVLGIGWQDRQ